MKVKTRVTFFFGESKPVTSWLRAKYFSTSFMKVLAFSLCPLKRGGSFPMALTFAAGAIGCSCAGGFAVAPPPPPGGPPPLSPIAMLRRSSSSCLVRGGGLEAVVDACAAA